MEIIDELGGWSTISTEGNRYGLGHKFETKLKWMERIRIELKKTEKCLQ